MHGFFGIYGTRGHQPSLADDTLVRRSYTDDKFRLTQVTLPKFLKDKYFEESDDCLIAVEGVLLVADSAVTAVARYRGGETTFWDSWRGSFCGVLYDKKEDKLLIFNDHIGSKMLFYVPTDDGVVFASDLLALARAMNLHEPDDTFVRAMLESGCTGDNRTFVEGVRRLTAGQYICVQGTRMDVHEYHRFDNTPYPYDEAMMLKETDRLFRQAVQRVISKNEQEGLRHFFPLSGGLDSRMAQWVARQETVHSITNYTYSQSGHYDHLLPETISKALGNQWEFFPLDGGRYITQIESTAAQTEWLVNYMGPIEIATFAAQHDWLQDGVVLTGVNGDNILAAEVDNQHEMERIYRHGFNGNSLGSPLVLQHYTETYSPFTDVDLLDFVLHVPTHLRRNYAFYDRWILTCYPEAAQWHHKHEQIGHRHRMATIAGRNIRVRDIPKRLVMATLKRLHIYDAYRAQKGESMNPYDGWVADDPQILKTLQAYFEAHQHLLEGQWFAAACAEKMRKGAVMEKGKALTILSALQAIERSRPAVAMHE